ncbi:MAG TPA: hypothetical protein PK239_04140 [Chitinophagales bacterium]|nr:hypothetical protein [Chitinophagales bacterium]HRK26461.1 hypothetical protein [Chitinophagales bacterium]
MIIAALLGYAIYSKEVARLYNGAANANAALPFDTSGLPAGTYYAVLRRAGGGMEQLPIMVVR